MTIKLAPLFAGIASGAVFTISHLNGLSTTESLLWSLAPTAALITWTWARRPMTWHRQEKEVTSDKAHSRCPDCRSSAKDTFIAGPSGGMSINVVCEKCKHEWNIMPIGDGVFHVIDDLGLCPAERLAHVYGIDNYRVGPTYEPVPKGKFRFEIDGRPAGPIRDTLGEAHGDAVRNGYAVYTEDGIKLDATQGATIERG